MWQLLETTEDNREETWTGYSVSDGEHIFACDSRDDAMFLLSQLNYRALLIKYIRHVGWHEGVSFLRDGDETDIFTAEEWAELQKLDKIDSTDKE